MTLAFDQEVPQRTEPEPQPSLLQSAQSLLRELPGLVSDRVKLVALEMRRAGVALAQIVGLVVAAAILLITAWLALWVGLAAGLIEAGLPWGWALLLVLAINLGAAFLALKRAQSLLSLLGLPATLRRLTVNSPQPPSMPSTAATHEHPAQQQPVGP